MSLLLPVFLVLFVFTLYLDPTIAGVPCLVCLHSVSWAYYCQCPLFCLSSLCILILLLPVSLVLFVFTLYLELTIASVPCFVCLHSVSWSYYCQCPLFFLSSLCILSLLLPVFLVLFVFTLYLDPTIASVPCFVCLHSVYWAYYCQCPLFCLSSLCILSLLLPEFRLLFSLQKRFSKPVNQQKNIDICINLMGRPKIKPFSKRKRVPKLYFHFWPQKVSSLLLFNTYLVMWKYNCVPLWVNWVPMKVKQFLLLIGHQQNHSYSQNHTAAFWIKHILFTQNISKWYWAQVMTTII